MLTIKNRERIREIILEKIIKRDIGKDGIYYNKYVFCPKKYNDEESDKRKKSLYDSEYLFPRSCKNRNCLYNPSNRHKILDIKDHRDGNQKSSLMNNGDTKQLKALWKKLKENNVKVIRELVVLFSDSDLELYRKYLEEEGFTEEVLAKTERNYKGNKKSLRDEGNKNYIALDLYLENLKIAIELDTDYTHPFPGIDRARDRFLWNKYGILVIRIKNYDTKFYEYESLIQKIISREKNDPNPWIFEQFDLILDNFIQDNQEFVESLDNCISNESDPMKLVDEFNKLDNDDIYSAPIKTKNRDKKRDRNKRIFDRL